jgi:hypothetical protein
VTGSCEYGNEISGSIKDGKFIDQVSNYQFLKEKYAPRSYLIYVSAE